MAEMSFGCGGTELGRDFLLGPGGLSGDKSGELVGPGPSVGGATFGNFGKLAWGDSTSSAPLALLRLNVYTAVVA